MDATIAVALAQDGVTTGAIYALLAISFVLVFAVTRVILIPQGAIVAFAALTFCMLERGQRPGIAGLVVALGIACFAVELLRTRRQMTVRRALRRLLLDVAAPIALYALVAWAAPQKPGLVVRIALTALLVVPLGPLLHRLAFEPLERASVLILLMAAMGVDTALTVLGLAFFGPEGFSAQPIVDAVVVIGDTTLPAQSLVVVGVPIVLMALLWAFFGRTLTGKSLRAVAINRVGAQLVGVPVARAGRIAFTMASLIGAVSGILIAPTTMLYYDSGFLIGLKGFVAAVVGGIGSYPLAVLGAFAIGQLQSFGSFWNSAYADAIVFMMVFPVLLWRSYRGAASEDPG